MNLMDNTNVKINYLLMPLSWIYGWGVRLRNLLFDMGVLKSETYTMPVISVGNISVGGAGKTPHVEYLIRLLLQRNNVAVLSRGYKRKTKGYLLAKEGMTADDIGDEPLQMFSKYGMATSNPDISAPATSNPDTSAPATHHSSRQQGPKKMVMAVDADRREGIQRLSTDAETKDTDVILLDDAYQHRYVKPGVNILLTDYNRLIIYDKLLPAGRLREPRSGKNRADIVIVTKCPRTLMPMDYRVITRLLDLYPYQKLYFTTLSYGRLTPVFPECQIARGLQISQSHHVCMLTGIASPDTMHRHLLTLTQSVTPLTFPDHHHFSDADVQRINETFDAIPEPRLMVTTEKDAARLVSTPGLSAQVKQALVSLPIEVEFMLDGKERFDERILSYVEKNSKNSTLSRHDDRNRQKHSKEHHNLPSDSSHSPSHHEVKRQKPETIRFD